MKVILNQDVDELGKMGDIVKVAGGHARNFLMPNGLVLPFNKANLKSVETLISHKSRKLAKLKENAMKLAEKMEEKELTVKVKVGEKDKMYGSVTSNDILTLIKDKGFEVEKKKVIFPDQIKYTGQYTIGIKLHNEVTANIKLNVEKEKE